jgi:hypothetical protein
MASTPSSTFNVSPHRWLVLPLPADANVSLPGSAFANETNSFSELALTEGLTTMMFGVDAPLVIGVKSFSGIYGGFS